MKKQIKSNKQETRTGRRRIDWKSVIVVGAFVAIVVGIVGAVGVGLWNGVDSVFSESTEDRKASKQLDELVEVYAEEGSAFDITATWGDDEVRHMIHQMSHQKVQATPKWGAVRITQERLESLSNAIDENEKYLNDYDTYRMILDRWIDGDFSHAVSDHNTIWDMQNGTVGKATAPLTKEQEESYIKDVFE